MGAETQENIDDMGTNTQGKTNDMVQSDTGENQRHGAE